MPAPGHDLPVVLRDAAPLGCEAIAAVAHGRARLAIGSTARARLANGRAIVGRILARGERAYGITTGLGALSDVALAPGELALISRNTLLSHACGVGPPLPAPEELAEFEPAPRAPAPRAPSPRESGGEGVWVSRSPGSACRIR